MNPYLSYNAEIQRSNEKLFISVVYSKLYCGFYRFITNYIIEYRINLSAVDTIWRPGNSLDDIFIDFLFETSDH